MADNTEALPPHPSHATVRDWMPVAEALRLADLWTVGDLDNSGQWRAAIKVLADEVRAALTAAPSAQAEPQVPLPCGQCRKADSWGIPLSKTCVYDCKFEPLNATDK